ncbi:MAG TPA: Mur ligase family protein, partial [Xanthomonadaceae bacterium]|nr:Mur ligase family protein [Xanthomonadaceae bacterium]
MLPEPVPNAPPFADSRRLLGANPYFGGVGAALETQGIAIEAPMLDAWRARVASARREVGWPDGPLFAQSHPGGATLAFAAPLDQLFTATDVNEWALLASAAEVGADADFVPFHAPGYLAIWDEALAMASLHALAASEASPGLIAIEQAAREHRLALLIDDTRITLGEGGGSRSWPMDPLPDVARIRWSTLHDVPLALVTGTNGKTTTVRLLAAMTRAHGWSTGHSCTDGLFVDGRQIASGDYSGPAGAREVLRQPDVQAAILETARGGILRRGLAVQRAQAAVITNISADHYGAYGVYGLDDLARVKLTVARVLDRSGLLVLNADDKTLRACAEDLFCAIGWFAIDNELDLLESHRASGGATCGVREGHVLLTVGGAIQDLGVVDEMPLSVGGHARYNISNILSASLAATALGVAATTIADVLTRFGAAHADNPGRLQHWSLSGVDVWLDYAHNPDGLRALLNVTGVAHCEGRFGLLLGQAGDRSDDDIRALASIAAAFRPSRVVLKDIAAYMRGRIAGEVAAILRAALVQAGVNADTLEYSDDEERGARALLAWAQPGDTL